MKKFISMVMAAAMVVSLVPATAFAADNTCTMKVVNATEKTKEDAASWKASGYADGAEIQITLGEIETKAATDDTFEIDLDFTGAKVKTQISKDAVVAGAKVTDVSTSKTEVLDVVFADVAEADDEYVTLKITEGDFNFATGDVIIIPVASLGLQLKNVGEGATASVSVSGDLGTAAEKTFATVVGQALKVTARKVAEVGEEEIAPLKKITVKTVKGDVTANEVFTLKLPSGFVWAGDPAVPQTVEAAVAEAITGATFVECDDNVLKIKFAADKNEFEIKTGELFVEAVSAKAGAVATLKVSVDKWDAASCDVAEVVAAAVKVTVDEDADVPEIYSGTAVNDTYLTSGGDHKALKVTIKESVADSWDTVKGFTMSLPEGVYVQNADFQNVAYVTLPNTAALQKAYEKGDYEEFVFGRRAFSVADNKAGEFTVELTLVAEPGFVGDAVLTIDGEGIGTHEVVIAKFVAPFTVEAAQNDVIIDYRNTEVKTDIVVKEAEAGLWAVQNGSVTGAAFEFVVDGINLEDDATIAVDEASEMELKVQRGDANFYVKEASNEEAAVVTINGIELYMSRNLPAGAYDLVLYTTMTDAFLAESVYGSAYDVEDTYYEKGFTHVVKEGFVNIVTAGRDKDDASFTKKVVVPVGEAYLIAGEETVALDVPAYINAAGYTMLPVRAVATALGIHNNNVIWSQAAKQVTILYGQRIITMTVGQSVIYVNGSAIPASAAVEVVDGRAFLGLRDLANALGVVEINWDAATSTATLN